MTNFQRKGAISNTHVGNQFERYVFHHFSEIEKIPLQYSFRLEIGFSNKKDHKFDFGCSNPKVVVECKAHTWTEGNKTPSAKMTTWDQAMLYFSLIPADYRKIFVVQKSLKNNESLCQYYLRTHCHLIPIGVEFWEADEAEGIISRI